MVFQGMESENYQRLSDFQKSVVDALKNMEYTHKYNQSWEKQTIVVNVSQIKNMEGLMKEFYKHGQQQKVWEIKRILEVN